MKMDEIVAARMRANSDCEKLGVDTRQRKARRLREATFSKITAMYGPEPRKIRRKLAMDIARRLRKG